MNNIKARDHLHHYEPNDGVVITSRRGNTRKTKVRGEAKGAQWVLGSALEQAHELSRLARLARTAHQQKATYYYERRQEKIQIKTIIYTSCMNGFNRLKTHTFNMRSSTTPTMEQLLPRIPYSVRKCHCALFKQHNIFSVEEHDNVITIKASCCHFLYSNVAESGNCPSCQRDCVKFEPIDNINLTSCVFHCSHCKFDHYGRESYTNLRRIPILNNDSPLKTYIEGNKEVFNLCKEDFSAKRVINFGDIKQLETKPRFLNLGDPNRFQARVPPLTRVEPQIFDKTIKETFTIAEDKIARIASEYEDKFTKFGSQLPDLTVDYIQTTIKKLFDQMPLDLGKAVKSLIPEFNANFFMRQALTLWDMYHDERLFSMGLFMQYVRRLLVELDITKFFKNMFVGEPTPTSTEPIKNYFTKVTRESGETLKEGIFSRLYYFFSVLLGAHGKDPKVTQFIQFTRFWDSFSKSKKMLKDFIVSIMDYLPKIIQEFYEYFFPKSIWTTICEEEGVYHNFMLASNLILEKKNKGLTINTDTWNMINLLIVELDHLMLDKLAKDPCPNVLFNNYERMKAKLDPLRSVNVDERPEPFVIYLYGTSGVGKTTLANFLTSYLLGKADVTSDDVYHRVPSNAYWDGYKQQPIVVYDEFGSDKAEEIDYKEMMGLVSTALYAPPMAGLVDTGLGKKGDNFTSKYIIICSNVQYPEPTSLADSTALWRRRHLCIEVKGTPEKMETNTYINFHPISSSRTTNICKNGVWFGNASGKGGDFKYLLESLERAYQAHQKNDDSRDIALKKLFNKYQRDLIQVTPQGNSSYYSADDDSDSVKPVWTTKEAEAMFETFRTPNAIIQAEKHYRDVKLKSKFKMKDFLSTLNCTTTFLTDTLKKVKDSVMKLLGNTTLKRLAYIGVISASVVTSIAAVTGLIAMLTKLNGVVKTFFTPTTSEMSGSTPGITNPKNSLSARTFTKVTPHSSERIDSIVGAVSLCKLTNLTRGTSVNAIPIGGTRFLTVKHFMDLSGKDDELEFCLLKKGGSVTVSVVPISACKLHHLDYNSREVSMIDKMSLVTKAELDRIKPDNDLILITLSKFAVPPQKNITNYFITEDELTKVSNGNLAILTYDGYARHTKSGEYDFKRNLYHGDDDLGYYYTPEAFSYAIFTSKGDCGSPLVLLNNSAVRIYAGMHFASTGMESVSRGLGIIVTQEMLSTFSRGMVQPPEELIHVNSECLALRLEGNFTPMGQILKAPHAQTKTKIIPSVLFEAFGPHRSEPAILHSHDSRLQGKQFDPLKKGVEKYGKVVKNLPDYYFEEVEECLKVEILKARKTIKPTETRRILTLEEAINGVDGFPYMQSLKMGTSPGYPWNIGGKKKKSYVDIDEEEDYVPREELTAAVEKRISQARLGKRVESYSIDTLKDERRILEKIYDEPKTRAFTNMPVDFTICGRMYTLPFISFMFQIREDCFSAVGMNPYSNEWHDMIQRMQEVGSFGFDVDVKNFDGTVHPRCVEMLLRIINWFYHDFQDEEQDTEDDMVREVLFNEVIHTVSIIGSQTYMKHVGNPSGVWITALMNSFVNAMYFRICYLILAEQHMPMYRDLSYFRRFTRDKYFGDDGILSVSTVINAWFNPANLFPCMKDSLGVTITNGDKSDNPSKENILDVTFLKNTIAVKNGAYVPNLDMNTLTEMLYWVRKSTHCTTDEILQQTIDSCLHFLYFYEESVYNEFTKVIRNASTKVSKVFDLKNYSYLHNAYSANNCFYDLEEIFNWNIDAKDRNKRKQKLLYAQNFTIVKPQMTETSNNETMDAVQAPIAETTRAAGVTTREQSKVQTASATMGAASNLSTRAESVLNESPWTLSTMLGKWSSVTTRDWTAVQPPGTVLITMNIIKDLLVSPIQSDPFNRFRYWRGTPTVKFQLNGNRFMNGKLVAVFVPFTLAPLVEKYQSSIQHLATVTCLPHVFLDAATSTTAELEIPFIYPNNWLDLGSGTPLGQLFVTVFNQLRVPESVDSVLRVKILTKFDGSTFKVPIPSDEKVMLRVNPQSNSIDIVKKDSKLLAKTPSLKSVTTTNSVDTGVYPQIQSGENNSDILAVDRAKTHDGGIVPHYEETMHSLQDIMKRYVNCGTYVSTAVRVDSSQFYTHVDIPININGLLFGPKASAGLITYYSRLYRFFRGSIRMKVRTKAYVTRPEANRPYTQWKIDSIDVTATPYTKRNNLVSGTRSDGTTRHNTANLAFIGPDGEIDSREAPIGSSVDVPIAFFSPPLAHTTYTDNLIEFEVPYMNQINTTPIICFGGDDDLVNTFDTQIGDIMITAKLSYDAPEGYKPEDNINTTTEIFVALGDGAHFGTVFGVPSLTQYDYSVGKGMNGSYWTVQATEEFTKVEAQMFSGIGAGIGKDLDNIVSEIIPDNVVGDLLGALLDKPTDANNPVLVVNKSQQFLPHAVNIEHIPTLNLYPKSQTLCDAEHFATEKNEMSIDYLVKELTPSRLSTFQWTTSDTSGHLLFQSWVGPMMEEMRAEARDLGVKKYPTLLDYVCAPFSFWRGGFVYSLEGIVNSFYTGRLQVTFYPGIPQGSVPTDPDNISSTSSYTTIIDVKDSMCYAKIVTPYLCDTPWKSVYNGDPQPSNLPFYNSGLMQVTVFSPLVTAKNISPVVDVNLYVQAASDFELAGLYNNNNTLIPFG